MQGVVSACPPRTSRCEAWYHSTFFREVQGLRIFLPHNLRLSRYFWRLFPLPPILMLIYGIILEFRLFSLLPYCCWSFYPVFRFWPFAVQWSSKPHRNGSITFQFPLVKSLFPSTCFSFLSGVALGDSLCLFPRYFFIPFCASVSAFGDGYCYLLFVLHYSI